MENIWNKMQESSLKLANFNEIHQHLEKRKKKRVGSACIENKR